MPRKKKQIIPARKMGRPSKYEGDKTLDAIDFYLNNFQKKPFNEQIPTMASLSNYLGLSKGTLKEWTRVENREELTVLLEKLLQKQEILLSLVRECYPFFLRNHIHIPEADKIISKIAITSINVLPIFLNIAPL